MSSAIIGLFALTIVLEVTGQLCFKIGLERRPEPRSPAGFGQFWRRIFSSSWLWGGIAAYALEIGLWLAVLAHAPLSLVFPLASLSYCGVLLASRIVLKEVVSPRRWAGAALITLGVATIGIGTQF
jgi:drug/metabolite transporter (DMT)-like permease